MSAPGLVTVAGGVLPWVWRDGVVLPAAEATVSALDRTLLYGLGAFETVRIEAGRPFMLARHLPRLARSLEAVGLDVPDGVADLAQGLPALAQRNGVQQALCRLTITAGDEGAAPGSVQGSGHVLAFLRSLGPWPAGRRVVVGIAHSIPDVTSPLSGIKSTNYLLHYLLRDEAQRAGRVDDLMVDPEGRVSEATVSNVFAVHDGALITPPLGMGILPGITRGLVLEIADDIGVRWEERDLLVTELAAADECFLTSSAKGVMAVDELDGRVFGPDRPVTDALSAAFVTLVRTECG